MRYAHPSRRQVEMAAEELDFDVFADSGSLAADVFRFAAVDELADCRDLLAWFDTELGALPGTVRTADGELVSLRFVSVDLLAGTDRRSRAEQARAAAWLDEVA
ncbi:MAG TPA: hypothetical protein VGL02_26985 [Streptomyces sp.]